MRLEPFMVITANFVAIGLLPRLFFRRDGRLGVQWWLTAAPFFIGYALQAAVFARLLSPVPLRGFEAAATAVAIPLSVASTALIALTVGSHRIPLALWHQADDEPRELVTWGAYRRIRHPFYTSFLLALAAGVLLAPHPGTIAALAYGITAMALTARREEQRLLASEFGVEYQAYAQAAGRFLPGVGRLPGVRIPLFVDNVAFALASQKASVGDSVAAGRTLTGEDELVGAGFRYHHLCADDESAYDLARAAVAPIADRLDGAGAIVYATCIPANANLGSAERFAATRDVKHLMDFPASRLQSHLGLDRAAVFGLTQQACTGLIGSVRVAQGLLATDPDLGRILCLTADRFPPGALYEQAYSLISDGAAACTVSRDSGAYRVVAAHHITNGAMVDADDDQTVGAYFTYTHRLVVELLDKAGLAPGDVDWVIPQNTDAKAWQILSRLVQIDFERVFFASLPDVAHMISGDNLVNLAYLEERGLAQAGDILLLVMAGYGMNWQALILERT